MLLPQPGPGGWRHFAFAITPEQWSVVDRASGLLLDGEYDAAAALVAEIGESRELDPTTALDVRVMCAIRERFGLAFGHAQPGTHESRLVSALERLSLAERPVSMVATRALAQSSLRAADMHALVGRVDVVVEYFVDEVVEAIRRLDRRRPSAPLDHDREELLTPEWVERIADPRHVLSLDTYADVFEHARALHIKADRVPPMPTIDELGYVASDFREWCVDDDGADIDAIVSESIAALRALTQDDRRAIADATESAYAPLGVDANDWVSLLEARLVALAEGTHRAHEAGLVVVSCVDPPTR